MLHSDKIKVLCVTDCSDRPETELFIGLRAAGVDLTVMCNPAGRNFQRLRQAGVPIVESVLKGRFDMKGMAAIRRQLKAGGYDILHSYDNRALQNSVLASFGIPVKIVAYRGIVGNVSFLDPASWLTYLNPKVKKISCVANAIRDYFLRMRLLGLKLPPEKVVTIYKGHQLDWYREPPADLSQFGIPEDAFVVGFAGRDRPRKGVNFLIDSAKYLPADAPVHYLLVGRMDDNPRLAKQIAASPFRDRIHLTGFRSDAPALAAACDAFVMPSIRAEGLPRAVIEAMAYGTPPIVADAGGSPELVVDRESGLIVPPADARAIGAAILELLEHPQQRAQMGKQARERIRSCFNSETTVRQTLQLYQQLLA
ncbi:MAG TPA: glycosyltransferase family 4 protein [Geopsychrobacteraceae bacterium]